MILFLRIAVVLLLFGLIVSPAVAQEKLRFYLGVSSKTLGYSPLWVAAKKGFSSNKIWTCSFSSARHANDGAGAGGGIAQCRLGQPGSVHRSSERGLDLVIIGGVINGLTHYIVGGKNYKTYEDLRGATLGASSLTSGTVTAFKQALKVNGLEYPRDYKILVVAGGSSANLAALQAGQIAATTVAIPLNYLAEEAGFNVIGRLIDAVPDFELTVIAAKRSWAEKNRSSMVRFMKGMAQANRWLYDNQEPAVDFLTREMQLKPNHARRGWEYYTQNRIWHPDGDLNLEGMKYNLRIYAEQTGAKGSPSYAKYIDQSYLYDALKELKKK
jgi:NitT/TauT family transport system substrate-binding protein